MYTFQKIIFVLNKNKYLTCVISSTIDKTYHNNSLHIRKKPITGG